MIPLRLIKDIETIVASLVETTNYVHSKFVFTPSGPFLVPLTDKPQIYPCVFSIANSVQINAPDLATQTVSLTLSYLRPTSRDLQDVPETLLKASDVIQTIIYELVQTYGYQIIADPLLTAITNSTAELVSGVSAQLLLSMSNEFNPCC